MYADLCARLATDARITAVCPSSEAPLIIVIIIISIITMIRRTRIRVVAVVVVEVVVLA